MSHEVVTERLCWQIAIEADVTAKSVKKMLNGGVCRGPTARRIVAALRARNQLHLLPYSDQPEFLAFLESGSWTPVKRAA